VTQTRPTLLSSCGAAATAKEAAFRIDAGPRIPRATRVVMLDPGAAEQVDPLHDPELTGVRYLHYEGAGAPADAPEDLLLGTFEHSSTRLSDELAEADFVLMVATDSSGAQAASAIGTACRDRGMVAAGVILGANGHAGAAVEALRPYARTLLVSDDRFDVAEVLRAVGS
jgi:hypothetical protein